MRYSYLRKKCLSFNEHQSHKFVEISKNIENKKEVIQRDIQELEKSIYPKYQEIASNIQNQKAALKIDNSYQQAWRRLTP